MMTRYAAILAVLLMAGGCNAGKARLDGVFAGRGGATVYLEEVLPGSATTVDSASVDERGEFGFRVTLPGGRATIYNLRTKNDMIPVLLSPGERVKVRSLGNLSANYTVSGSDESALVREIRMLLAARTDELDSILAVHAVIDESMRGQTGLQYRDAYYRAKRDHIAFIVTHAGTLASFYALYQRLPGDDYLYDGRSDVAYYRLVADSMERHYPGSPYLDALRRDIAQAERTMELESMVDAGLRDASGHPDLDMADMNGTMHKLSALKGQVVLLDFWSPSSAQSRLDNAEYRRLWDSVHDRGFEIYQVAVDAQKLDWVNAVLDQKLPWTSVCDLRGGSALALRLYNVGGVPANFLIDRNGDIVARDVYGDELARRVNLLLGE